MAGKLLLGSQPIALLFVGETPIQRVMLGSQTLWASLLRLPAEQYSAVRTAALPEAGMAEAEGLGAGLRAVFWSGSSASLLGMDGFASQQAGRGGYRISPVLIAVCKPQFDGRASIRETEAAQPYRTRDMAYRDRAGVREQYTAYWAGMAQAGQKTGANSRFTLSGDTAGMDQLSPVRAAGESGEKASALTGDAAMAGADAKVRSAFYGTVYNAGTELSSAESSASDNIASLSAQDIRDGPWAEQDGNKLYIYQSYETDQFAEKLWVM